MIEEYVLFILEMDQVPLQQLGRFVFFTAIDHDFRSLLIVPVRTILDVSGVQQILLRILLVLTFFRIILGNLLLLKVTPLRETLGRS